MTFLAIFRSDLKMTLDDFTSNFRHDLEMIFDDLVSNFKDDLLTSNKIDLE